MSDRISLFAPPAPAKRQLEPVICGCGRSTGRYAYRSPGVNDLGVLVWVGPTIYGAGSDSGEAIQLLDHWHNVTHRCPKKAWPKDARLLLESERA